MMFFSNFFRKVFDFGVLKITKKNLKELNKGFKDLNLTGRGKKRWSETIGTLFTKLCADVTVLCY